MVVDCAVQYILGTRKTRSGKKKIDVYFCII